MKDMRNTNNLDMPINDHMKIMLMVVYVISILISILSIKATKITWLRMLSLLSLFVDLLSIWLSFSLPVYLSIDLSGCFSNYLSIYPSVFLSRLAEGK